MQVLGIKMTQPIHAQGLLKENPFNTDCITSNPDVAGEWSFQCISYLHIISSSLVTCMLDYALSRFWLVSNFPLNSQCTNKHAVYESSWNNRCNDFVWKVYQVVKEKKVQFEETNKPLPFI